MLENVDSETDGYSSTTENDAPTTTDVTPTSTDATPTDTQTLSTETPTAISNASITTRHLKPDPGMDTGGSVAVAIVVALLCVAGILLFLYLRRTGRLKCFRRGRPRRSSTSSSLRALDPDDNESVDNMPRVTDSDMFAITEPEEQDQEQEVGGDDGYYYDEVFGSSGFEDETTKASNKELFSISSDQEAPDLLLRVEDLDFK